MTQTELLQRIKERLQALYGPRFRGLVPYGSEARGEAREDSDIDLLCLLDGSAAGEITRIVDATYPLRLESDKAFHVIPVDAADYQAGDLGFLRIVRREGVPV